MWIYELIFWCIFFVSKVLFNIIVIVNGLMLLGIGVIVLVIFLIVL